ncbi:hypothetical protein KIN20_020503 [Parelaphostrongylus tenuis]|uniref:Uncharacterized protein n=1 Tax=Parelaphostrongylus tenuis TaxID=148309 RepID=A0AAD5QTJ6_PARTN|nr:hypothetical protein KIN20_020503 [Parelaphostrongylus tenuis]
MDHLNYHLFISIHREKRTKTDGILSPKGTCIQLTMPLSVVKETLSETCYTTITHAHRGTYLLCCISN